jgi:hypothetical protein
LAISIDGGLARNRQRRTRAPETNISSDRPLAGPGEASSCWGLAAQVSSTLQADSAPAALLHRNSIGADAFGKGEVSLCTD